jgi:hypothetical protein
MNSTWRLLQQAATRDSLVEAVFTRIQIETIIPSQDQLHQQQQQQQPSAVAATPNKNMKRMKMEGGVGGKEEDSAADEHAQQQMAELKAEIRIKDALIQSLQAQLARYRAAHASAPAPSRSLSPKAVAKNTFVAAAAVVPGAMFLFSSRP